ncbi:hypothetical protein LCGC14_0374640 [marine sediment metagenome]|uniref:Uncharacterized protein n=1 Tax=marine sediment metagenome TaxID=412755 RepID=A0A0F9TA40_9ZZZZ
MKKEEFFRSEKGRLFCLGGLIGTYTTTLLFLILLVV